MSETQVAKILEKLNLIHMEVISLGEKFKAHEKSDDSMHKTLKEDVDDHEDRLRKVEARKGFYVVLAAIVSALGGYFARFYQG